MKSTGSGEYLSSPFLSTVSRVWNVALVPSVALPSGTILVGDTTIGLTLQVREGANLRISDADTDDYTRNRVTLLCEGRWSLCVWIPAAFCTIPKAWSNWSRVRPGSLAIAGGLLQVGGTVNVSAVPPATFCRRSTHGRGGARKPPRTASPGGNLNA